MTAGVAVPVLLWLMYWAPPIGMVLLMLAAVVIAGIELFAMVTRGERGLQVWGTLASVIVAISVLQVGPGAQWIDHRARVGVLTVLTIGGLMAALWRPSPSAEAGARMGWLIGGPLYAGGFLANVANLHGLPEGGSWVLLSMVVAWLGDTGAYFAGRFLGKHRLYPQVSPNKTVEGAIGGLAGSLVGALFMSLVLMETLSVSHALALTLIASPLGMCGDLFASLIKRSTNTKDSGWIVPGHGGLLDRVDALMFTATVAWLYAWLVLDLA